MASSWESQIDQALRGNAGQGTALRSSWEDNLDQALGRKKKRDEELETQPTPKKNGIFREIADTGVALTEGAIGAGQALTNLAGADNFVSRGLDTSRKVVSLLASDEQRAQRKAHGERMRSAEATGEWTEELNAAWQNFKEDPFDYAAQGVGSIVTGAPVRLISAGAKVAGVSGRTLGLAGIGGAQGVGAVKGAQYDAVKEAKLAEGFSEEEASAAAVEAQSYKADNAVDLLTGGALGVIAGSTGADRLIGGVAGTAGRGLVKRVVTNTLAEAPVEGVQGGQERYAANQSLIRDGYDVNPWKGVTGNAATEALMSAPVGAASGAVEGYTPTQAEIDSYAQRQQEFQARERDAALSAQQQAEQQRQEARAKAERDANRAYYAEQLPFETFKKQRVEEITNEQLTPDIIDNAYQEAFRSAVEQEIAPPTREKFEKQYKGQVKKEIAKSTDELTQEYYETLDSMAASEAVGTDLLGDPVDLNAQDTDPEAEAEPAVEPQANRRQMDFLGELDRTVQPGYSPVMPVATPGEGTPASVTFTQTPVDDSGLPGALQEAKTRAKQGGVTVAPPNSDVAGNPLLSAKSAAVKHGVSKGTWAKFVSSRNLIGAGADTIAEAIRDRAINGSGSNNPAWEAAHAAVTGITIDEYLTEQEQRAGNGAAIRQVPGETTTAPLGKADAAPAVVVPELATQQKRVYDVLVAAAQDGDLDNYVASDGTINYQRIADQVGVPRQSIKAAIDQTVKRFEQANGGKLREKLANRTKAVRTTEAADEDMLGTSPANFTKGSLQVGARLDKSDLFGDDDGASQSFGVVETAGGSQSAVGQTEVAPVDDKPDPVAERRKSEAATRMDEVHRKALSQPQAAEAAADWDDMRSSNAPFAKDLSRQDAYEWLMNYMEWKNGDTTEETLAADQLEIERRYDADPQRSIVGNRGDESGGATKPRVAKGDSTPETPARPDAEETAGVQNETAKGLDLEALSGLLAQLRDLGKEPKHAATAKDFLKRAIDGENVEAEAGAWVNAVNEDRRGEVKFSRDAGSSRENLDAVIEQWAGVVDAFLDKTLDRTKAHTLFPSTPASMQVLGLPDLPVMIGKHALDYANIRLTSQEMKALPEMMADPQLVYLHEGADGELSLNFVLDSGGYNGANVVALHPNRTGKGEREVHYVATLMNIRPESIAREVREGRGMYQGEVNAPVIKAAFQEAKRKSGRESAGLRELMSRRFGRSATLPRIMYRTDLVKLVSSGTALYAKNGDTNATKGQDAAPLRDKMRKLFVNPVLFDKRVTVVQSEADLPAKYNTRQSKQGATRMAFYDPATGNVYLIADNVLPGREFGVFLHEVGGHMGMRNLLGKANFDALYGQINTWAEGTGSIENDVANAALDRVLIAGVTTEGEVKEELIAYFVEEAVRRGINPSALATQPKTMQAWFRTLWNAVKTAVQKLGVNPATLTAKDVVDLAYGAARLELNGSQTDIDAAADASGRPATDVAFTDSPSTAAVMNSVKSEKRKVDEMIDELPEHLSKPAHWMNTNFSELMKGSGNMLWFTDYLVDSAKGVLPTAKAWFESMKARETIRIRNEERVDQIARLVDKLSQSEFNRTWKLIHDMTRNKKWSYAPTWKTDVTVDPDMALQHAALGGKEREVVDAVLKHGHDTLLETNAALTTIANDLFDEKVARTRDPVKKHQLMKDKAQYLRVYGRKLLVSSDPYAPMRRVGTHATVGKSQLYLDTEALAKAGNKAAMDKLIELRTDDRHHKVAFSDNQYEAENIAREYRAAGLKAIASVKEVFTSSDQMPFQAFQALREMASEKEDEHSLRVMGMIDELYLESLADVSARKSELRREGTGGLNPDTMYKAFLAHGKSTAHYLSVLKTHRDVAGKFAEMRTQAREPTSNRHAKMTVFNEMKKRFDASFNYEPAPFINKLMNLSTYWMLLTKPAYYVYNLTQPFMMTLPYMTKRHDYTAAADHMVRAYSDLLKLPKAVSFEHFDLHSLPADIRDAIVELRDMGRIDITITQDLGKRIHSGDGMASKYVARMDGFFRGMAQKTEMANRIVTAATAFRLHMEKNPNDRAGAMEYAAEVIDRTQGDYSNFNAPRLFNMNNAARLLTQFRKFQMIQVTLLVSMVKGIKNPYERAANTRALMFVLGHHALMAGAMGFPAINLIAMAFAATGDDEEPRDLELWMKNNLGDDELGKVLRYGVPSLFNINMSGNIGMGQTFAVIPYADVDATRSGYDSLITSLAGPTFGGLGPQFWAAGGKALDGDYYGFLAGMMPGFLKSSMIAMRESVEGAKTGAGDVLVSAEDIVFADTLAKSMGFKTINDTTRQLVTGKRYEFEAFFRGKVRDIKRDYNEAYREGDGAKLEELREQWVNLQSFRRDYGFKAHPLSELMKAPAEQAKRERNTLNGVQFTNQNRGFVIDNAEEEATAE